MEDAISHCRPRRRAGQPRSCQLLDGQADSAERIAPMRHMREPLRRRELHVPQCHVPAPAQQRAASTRPCGFALQVLLIFSKCERVGGHQEFVLHRTQPDVLRMFSLRPRRAVPGQPLERMTRGQGRRHGRHTRNPQVGPWQRHRRGLFPALPGERPPVQYTCLPVGTGQSYRQRCPTLMRICWWCAR